MSVWLSVQTESTTKSSDPHVRSDPRPALMGGAEPMSDVGRRSGGGSRPLSPPGGLRLVVAGVLNVRRNGALGG